MRYLIKTGDPIKEPSACLIVAVFARRQLSETASLVDQASEGYLTHRLRKGDIDGEVGDSLLLFDVPGIAAERLLLVGLGKQKEITDSILRKGTAAAVDILNKGGARDAVSCLLENSPESRDLYYAVRDSVVTAEERVYRFDEMKSESKKPKRPLGRLTLFISDRRKLSKARRAAAHAQAMAAGSALAKNLGNLPGNICTPTYLAEQAKKLGRKSRKLRIEILDERKMQNLGMGALLSVSSGSRQPARLIVMEYRGKARSKPVVLVGKGLTFDAGGISIKPSANMDEMKFDMCGGASVFGVMAACIELELPINLVGIVPASENLPDGNANKPGDIVTSMSGQTIEILNTDAEGRLILCDALTYAERFEPAAVIDIATLTGACVVALGSHASGLFSNNDSLADEVLAAGTESGDRAWRLPLWDDYQNQLDSNFADMANIGGKGAGAVTAACFLSRFTRKFKWAHLDIAGSAWNTGSEKGSTGRPVPLLTQFLLRRCGMSS